MTSIQRKTATCPRLNWFGWAMKKEMKEAGALKDMMKIVTRLIQNEQTTRRLGNCSMDV